jgi:two-component system, LytTR family, response regulator
MAKKISCIIVDDEPTAREIIADHLSKIESVKIVGSCASATEAFTLINTQKVDLIFLDINMPEISGLSFARSINNEIKIIFTTAYREYALDGFDLQAVDYLLKPISFERLFRAVNSFHKIHFNKEEPQQLVRIRGTK